MSLAVAVEAGSSGPDRGLPKQQLAAFSTLKLFLPPIRDSGNATLKRIAVAYPKIFLSGLLGGPSFLRVDHGRGGEGAAV